MPKQLYNTTFNNQTILPSPLVASGYVPLQILDSASLSTLLTQSNWAGNYYSILTNSSTNLSIPSSINLTYLLYKLISPIGCTITINLSIGAPAIDIGQVINIWNNTNAISYFNTQADDTLITIQPREWIKILVVSPTEYLIVNDAESYNIVPVGSIKDLFYNNSSIAGLNSRGWYRLDPTTTIGSAGIGSVKKQNFKKFCVAKLCRPNKNIVFESLLENYLEGDQFYLAYITLWNNTSLPVSDGRGSDANTDWNAGKTISIGGLPGGALVQSDSGVTSPNFAQNGNTFGSFTHVLSVGELANHRHPPPTPGGRYVATGGPPTGGFGNGTQNQANPPINATTGPEGNDQPHNNTQPSLAVGRMIRLF